VCVCMSVCVYVCVCVCACVCVCVCVFVWHERGNRVAVQLEPRGTAWRCALCTCCALLWWGRRSQETAPRDGGTVQGCSVSTWSCSLPGPAAARCPLPACPAPETTLNHPKLVFAHAADDDNDAVLFEKIKKGNYDADDPIWVRGWARRMPPFEACKALEVHCAACWRANVRRQKGSALGHHTNDCHGTSAITAQGGRRPSLQPTLVVAGEPPDACASMNNTPRRPCRAQEQVAMDVGRHMPTHLPTHPPIHTHIDLHTHTCTRTHTHMHARMLTHARRSTCPWAPRTLSPASSRWTPGNG